jgi:capsular exopolysaccharide synthesis family protein
MNKALQAKQMSGPLDVDMRHQDADESVGGVVNVGTLLRTLWRGKFIIALVTSLAVLAGGYYGFVLAQPLYKSTAVVMLNNQQSQVVDIDSVVSGLSADTSTILTEVEILKSRSLLGKVVDTLNLVDDPEFNHLIRPPSTTDKIKLQVRELFGVPPEEIVLDDAETQMRMRNVTINGLLDRLTIRDVPNSLVFQVTVESSEARKSAAIADTIVDQHILNQLQVKFDATEQATKWLSERVAELQVSLEAAESAVKEKRASTDLVSPEALTALENQLKDVRFRITETEALRAASRQRLADLGTLTTPEEKVAATDDPQLRRLLPRLDQPAMAEAFDTRFEQIVERTALDVSRSDAQLAALQASQEELEVTIGQQSADLIELQQLTRESEASRLLYEYFLSRLKETSAQQGIQQADSRVLSSAVVPVMPFAPRKTLILAFSFLVGVMLSSALILGREARNNPFRSAEDLERITTYPVIGQLPLLPIRRRRDALGYLADKPTSAAAEAVRNLRTSVLLSNVDEPPKVIMTCSSFPGEGKTTISLALAQNLSQMGKSVLLVEGDVRRRVFSQYIKTDNPKGLISVLSESTPVEEAIVTDSRVGCDVLLADKSTGNAADIFASKRFAEFLDESREKYDHIIIDTPPVLVVPDARIIAQNVDALVFVVRWDKTNKHAVIDGLREFESVNVRAAGLVLNQISVRGMKRYGYGSKYGTYSVYGSKYYIN